MIKIDDHTDVDLDVLAQQHYTNLIGLPLADGINYHATQSLVGRIRKQRTIDAALPDLIRTDFWDYLLANNFANLIRLITSRPAILKDIINEVDNMCGAGFFSNDIDYEEATLTPFGEIVKSVFNYKLYRTKSECRENCEKLKLSYCPYCNEQVTQVVTGINGLTGLAETMALLQLDHFYPQSRHPYLSVSFFNLIPGCSPCNAQLKQEKRFDVTSHFNPFDKRLDDYFQFNLESVFLSKLTDVEISYANKLAYSDRALVDFKILSRYANIAHKRVIYKLYQALKNYSPKVNRSISQQIIGLFTTESKRRILLDNYNIPLDKTKINEVQLGKLKRDITIQLGALQDESIT
ncbi:hypothetical protein PV783_08320 [Chitinophaga sp. CC14]|uniref:hypothetical protein n=1 Tax=Chitinophaga sp. CC14 TaxID=3029199 RepID=UPI003B7E5DF4